MQLQGVASLPAGATGTTDGEVELVTLAQAAALLACGGQATHLPVLVHGLCDPLGVWVAADGLVEGVDEDDLEELVGGVLAHPVAVQDPQAATVTSSTLLVDQTSHVSSMRQDSLNSVHMNLHNTWSNFNFSPLFVTTFLESLIAVFKSPENNDRSDGSTELLV